MKGKEKMKIRRDYVTNSSSSSFVIAYKELPKIDDKLIEQYPYLRSFDKLIENTLLTNCGGYQTEEAEVFESLEFWDDDWVEENKYHIRDYEAKETVEGILKSLENKEKEYGFSYQDEKDSYLKPAEYLKKGYKIMRKRVSYSDEWISNLIQDLEDGENFIVISGKEY